MICRFLILMKDINGNRITYSPRIDSKNSITVIDNYSEELKIVYYVPEEEGVFLLHTNMMKESRVYVDDETSNTIGGICQPFQNPGSSQRLMVPVCKGIRYKLQAKWGKVSFVPYM